MDNICGNFNKIYISVNIMAVCHFRISNVKDKENWLLVFEIVSAGFSWLFGPTENYSWPE
jgi:hypothetical protein